MEKRGISSVISVVLLTLLVVASVTILWIGVSPLVTQEIHSDILDTRLVIEQGDYTYHDLFNSSLHLRVVRGSDSFNLSGIRFVVVSDGESYVYDFDNPPVANGGYVYTLDVSTLTDIEYVNVVPLLIVRGNIIEGKGVFRLDSVRVVGEEISNVVEGGGGRRGGGGSSRGVSTPSGGDGSNGGGDGGDSDDSSDSTAGGTPSSSEDSSESSDVDDEPSLSPECNTDIDCDDGLFCNGVEVCNGGVCNAGTPPQLSDGISCTQDSCNEETDSVTHVSNHSYCDNGQYCDGIEYCDVEIGCVSGSAPVVSDDISCTEDSCDEVNDVIVHVPVDSLCDNGQYCDGSETCSVTLGCVSGVAIDVSDGISCTQDSCDESTDSVVHDTSLCECLIDSDCNDGNSCTADSCVSGVCVSNADDSLSCDDGSYCTVNDRCNSGVCISDLRDVSDGISCTQDSCDEVNDVLLHVPDHSFCDNDLFCDGIESCDVSLGCISGDNVNVPEVASCASATCNELSDTIDINSDNLECDDSISCTLDLCDSVEGCSYLPDDSLCPSFGCSIGFCSSSRGCVYSENLSCAREESYAEYLGNDVALGILEMSLYSKTSDGWVLYENVLRRSFSIDDNSKLSLASDVSVGWNNENVRIFDEGFYAVNVTFVFADRVYTDSWEIVVDGDGDVSILDRLYEFFSLTGNFVFSSEELLPMDLSVIGDEFVLSLSTQDDLYSIGDVILLSAPTECNTDIDCDDGLFCNGVEVCNGGVCNAGTPPQLSDGISCTQDSCNDTLGKVVHSPVDSLCDDGVVCNGAESCSISLGCVSGVAPQCNDGEPAILEQSFGFRKVEGDVSLVVDRYVDGSWSEYRDIARLPVTFWGKQRIYLADFFDGFSFDEPGVYRLNVSFVDSAGNLFTDTTGFVVGNYVDVSTVDGFVGQDEYTKGGDAVLIHNYGFDLDLLGVPNLRDRVGNAPLEILAGTPQYVDFVKREGLVLNPTINARVKKGGLTDISNDKLTIAFSSNMTSGNALIKKQGNLGFGIRMGDGYLEMFASGSGWLRCEYDQSVTRHFLFEMERGATNRIYVDSQLCSEGESGVDGLLSNSHLYVGQRTGVGVIDEISIWNGHLTESEREEEARGYNFILSVDTDKEFYAVDEFIYLVAPSFQTIHVSNLNADGPGSLREALSVVGPREIIFDVGGVIDLTADSDGVADFLHITEGDVVVRGETAPDPGISVLGAGVIIDSVSNVELRNFSIYATHFDYTKSPSDVSNDALKISGDLAAVENITISHMNLLWALDETSEIFCWSFYPGVYPDCDNERYFKNITYRGNIIGDSLLGDRNHAQGLLVSQHVHELLLVDNLFLKNRKRNPKLAGDSDALLINNLVYYGQSAGINIGTGTNRDSSPSLPTYVAALGNVYLPGPGGSNDFDVVQFVSNLAVGTQVHLADNLFVGRGRDWSDGNIQWSDLDSSGGLTSREFSLDLVSWNLNASIPSLPWMNEVLSREGVISSNLVEDSVLRNVGARSDIRNDIVTRLISEVSQRRGSRLVYPLEDDVNYLLSLNA